MMNGQNNTSKSSDGHSATNTKVKQNAEHKENKQSNDTELIEQESRLDWTIDKNDDDRAAGVLEGSEVHVNFLGVNECPVPITLGEEGWQVPLLKNPTDTSSEHNINEETILIVIKQYGDWVNVHVKGLDLQGYVPLKLLVGKLNEVIVTPGSKRLDQLRAMRNSSWGLGNWMVFKFDEEQAVLLMRGMNEPERTELIGNKDLTKFLFHRLNSTQTARALLHFDMPLINKVELMCQGGAGKSPLNYEELRPLLLTDHAGRKMEANLSKYYGHEQEVNAEDLLDHLGSNHLTGFIHTGGVMFNDNRFNQLPYDIDTFIKDVNWEEIKELKPV